MKQDIWLILSTLVLIFSISYGLMSGFTSEILGMIKPITVFQYSCFFTFALLLNKYLQKLNPYKEKLLTIGFLFLLASGYEVLWNFFFWFSNYGFYGINTDIDEITYNDLRHKFVLPFNLSLNITETEYFENKPVNLNINSKISFLVFICSLYFIFKLH